MAESLTAALPGDLFAQVLQRIDVREQVGSCSLVNSLWDRAVKSIFSSLKCELRKFARHQNLSSWLINNSSIGGITCTTSMIDVGSKPQHQELYIAELPALQLPYLKLSDLQILKLQCCFVQPANPIATDSQRVHTVLPQCWDSSSTLGNSISTDSTQ